MQSGGLRVSIQLTTIAFVTGVAANALTNQIRERFPPDDTAIEAVAKVFAFPSVERSSQSPLTPQATRARIRPLQSSTFEPLRKYFSLKQQRNIDQFLQALTDLVHARKSRARLVAVQGHSWWPPTVDDTKVAAVLSRDLLCDRYEPPEKTTFTVPKRFTDHLRITVRESFTEHGQDRVLGEGTKTSIVILMPENGRWVIDEVVSTMQDSNGTRVEKLTDLLRQAIKPLRKARKEISALPPPEVRRANKAH